MSRPSENTRDAIVKAAVRLFAEKGFQGTSVRDIIVKARVNQAAINYHFKSKDGLYLGVALFAVISCLIVLNLMLRFPNLGLIVQQYNAFP
jgi:AcrR family transcriptional regulator